MEQSKHVRLCKLVVMEKRPRLQSVNVYLLFNTEFPANSIDIRLKPDKIQIFSDKNAEEISCMDFKIHQDSISSLVLKNDFATFRFCTSNLNNELGTFKSDIVEIVEIENDTENFNLHKVLDTNFKYDIKCIHCLQYFCKGVQFKKILPLPSENADFGEWFCHAPTSNFKFDVLNPEISDLFYSSCYFHINLSLLKDGISFSEGSRILCKNCSFELGKLEKKAVCKLWFHTACLHFNNSRYESQPLEDCFRAIRNCLNNSVVGSYRILFYYESPQKSDFIFLWIMEKKLRLYVKDFNGSEFSDKINKVAKVLFKFTDIATDEEVKKWRSDQTVVQLEISLVMMTKLREHLNIMHKYIPENFSVSNGFYISYVSLYNK
ncbi:uncharacterized protein LOC108736639 [Agrilus planipennis]|uniref:E3 ubiquitin-protein ligase E3D n=1 Tax=Agrilus planipennis TaxID=224129 RepID=A0A1W4WX48_AGRPL|nr:uncharacterized protein LOC108736639 [Agrilus planipennis]